MTDDKVGTWWRFTEMRTRFERNVQSGFADKGNIICCNRIDAIHFCVRTAIHFMISLSYYPVVVHQHGTNHRVGRYVA